MSSFLFKAEKREDFGTSHSRRLRKKGLVPAIVYASTKEPFGISLDSNAVINLFNNESVFSSIVEVELEGNKFPSLIKAVQYHPSKGSVTHIDFQFVDTSVEITTTIPIHFTGTDECIGVKKGGEFVEHLFNIEVSCLPKDLPEFIQIDVSKLEMEGQIFLSEIAAPNGVEFVDLSKGEESVDHLICSVEVMKTMQVEQEEPEVVEEEEADKNE